MYYTAVDLRNGSQIGLKISRIIKYGLKLYFFFKEKSTELEEEVSRLKSLLKNEERKMDDLNKLTKQLQEERGQVVDIIRQEFADRLSRIAVYFSFLFR